MHDNRRFVVWWCVVFVVLTVCGQREVSSEEVTEQLDYVTMKSPQETAGEISESGEIFDKSLSPSGEALPIDATDEPMSAEESYDGDSLHRGSEYELGVTTDADYTSQEMQTDTTTDSRVNTAEECPKESALPCVSKCCPFGQRLEGETCKRSRVRFIPQFTILVNGFNDTNPVNETEKMDRYNLIAQNICLKNRYRLEPSTDERRDEFHLLFNGSLWLPNAYPTHLLILSNQYCMEVFDVNGEEMMLPLVCFPDTNDIQTASFHFIVYPIGNGLLVSVPFLVATFLVYNLIPDLRDLHGKTLSCYVMCLTIAYIFLAAVQLGSDSFNDNVCVGLAFAIQFSFLACFFWLNALCFDTWRNYFFHGKINSELPKSTQRSYFFLYSIYAWSCTIILIVITMVMNFEPKIPSSYLKPTIGLKSCWFNTQMEAVPYFYGPVAVLLITNVGLYIVTVVKLGCDYRKHRGSATDKKTLKQTVHLCLSLFFIMGINWLLELISWAAGGPPFIWYITDICNTLQGVFIFIVFVMESRVRKLCSEKLFPRLPCYKKKNTEDRPMDHIPTSNPNTSVESVRYNVNNGEIKYSPLPVREPDKNKNGDNTE